MATKRTSRTSTRTRKRRTSRTTYTRRRRTSVASTLGTAVGTALVSLFFISSWPVRIAVIVGALLAAVAWFVWTNRRAIADDARAAEQTAGSAPPAPPPV